MNNLDELQQLMDEQQEIHERLLVGRDPNKELRDKYESWAEDTYDAYEKSREGPFHPIPAPQKQDLPQGDTTTATEEIDALKRRIQALENYLWGMRASEPTTT